MNRNSTQIMGEILNLSQEQVATSTILRSCNLPHPRFKQFMGKLLDAGLIAKFEKDWVITKNGRTYLTEWKKFYDLAGNFGLEL